MTEWIAQFWPWSFVAAWLAGVWGLYLVVFGRFRRRRRADETLPAFRRRAVYVRLEYRIPAGSHNSLPKIVRGAPDGKSIYLRAEFFLKALAGFRPDTVLEEWFRARKWAAARRYYQEQTAQGIEEAITAIRRRDLSNLFHQRPLPKEKPLALSFPLLPIDFTVFVARRFPYVHDKGSGIVEPGLYACRVRDWRDDDSYASDIDMKGTDGHSLTLDQTTLLDAMRLRKAAVESVRFLGLPIYVLVTPYRRLPKLRREQRAAGTVPVRAATARDFAALDSRLLKLFGGINPLNLLRLSWFYHPEHGIKPDAGKYRRLTARANGGQG